MRNSAHIRTVDLKCHLGMREIIAGIDLEVGKGQFCSIIGPNGSGKTTLLRAMAASLRPVFGDVLLDDRAISGMNMKDIARKLAYVSQNTNIEFEFNVTDYVMIGRQPYLRLFQSEGAADMVLVRRAMEITNIWQLRDKNIQEISGGERQRVILARALAQDTPIVLLDEPISQLDIHHQVELMDTLHDMSVNHGITIITVLHDLNMASQYSDQIVLLNGGSIVRKGHPEEVLRSDVISGVYGTRLNVIDDPESGRPLIIPCRKRSKKVEKDGSGTAK